MEISSLEVENFRQFRGTHRIEFARGDKNVTVVYGANGRGKTGLFRALMFCLYGDLYLDQDCPAPNKPPKEQIHLVNLHLLRDAGNKPVTARVTLEFSDGPSTYTLVREMQAILGKDNLIHEQLGRVDLSQTGPSGNNTKLTDAEAIQAVVDKILNRRIRSYFLFDGERIERLTRADSTQKDEVRTGIRALLRLDELELAIEGLKKLKRKLDDDVKSHSEGDLKRAENQLTLIEDNLTTVIADSERKSTEIAQAELELEAISDKITQIEAVAEKEALRQNLIQEKSDCRTQLENCFKGMRQQLNSGGLIVGGMEVAALHEQLQLEVDRGQLPPNIKAEFIDALLERCRCICGSCFEPGDNLALELAQFRETIAPAGTESLVQLYHDLNTVKTRRDYVLQDTLPNLFLQWTRLRDRDEELDGRIHRLSEEIKGLGGDDTKQLAETRSRLEETVERLKGGLAEARVKKGDLEAEQTRVETDIKRLTEHDRVASTVRQKRDLVKEAMRTMQALYERYAARVRKTLEARSTELFQTLADEATQMSLDKIKIYEDYSLNVANWAGKPILADISAGQRQVVSLSFISALISVAGGGGIYQVPLFMDTPFGRLSRDHRRSLLHSLPGLASQWVLLATDTEFGKLEKNYLMETGKWSKLYLLEAMGPGETRIRETQIGAFNPEREAARERALN